MVRTSWSMHACFKYVARTSWRNTPLYTLVEAIRTWMRTWYGPVEVVRTCWVRVVDICYFSNSVYVEVRFHDCAALMMKDHSHHGHSFNCSPITCLNRPAIDNSTRHLPLGCIGFLERSIALSASRRSHIPIVLWLWFMSSAWSFALATQTALAVRFCTRSSCDSVS